MGPCRTHQIRGQKYITQITVFYPFFFQALVKSSEVDQLQKKIFYDLRICISLAKKIFRAVSLIPEEGKSSYGGAGPLNPAQSGNIQRKKLRKVPHV